MSQVYPITTITNLQRNLKKEFSIDGYKLVLSNLNDVGLIAGKELANILITEGILDQIMEEMREARDPATVKMVTDAKKGKKYADTLSLDNFQKKFFPGK